MTAYEVDDAVFARFSGVVPEGKVRRIGMDGRALFKQLMN
ncbi:hypothetical protein SOASR031_37450 [Leminorella grimontii]|nr:hypothetical protein SOASR031_37450 [Leminorella grimontii]